MAELKTPQELGTEKIGKLLIRYAVPAMIAMLASSLYNIVDRAFIGHGVGPMALSGLAVTFPLMNLSAALGSMVGVGSGTMISLKLGQKDHESAQMLLGNSVTLNILIGVLFGALSLIFINPILTLFGATEVTIGYAREYMVIILAGNAFTHLYLGINCILRAAGHPNKAMVATIGTVLLNTLLDYLFIMVFHWGIKGAAIATVISQVLAFVWQCFQLSDKSELIHLKKGTFRLHGDLVRNMLTIGLSPCLMNAAACFVVLLINRGLLKYGSDVAIGAYSIINSIGFMVVMMVMGFNQAMQPIAGYNYGARQMGRVLRVLNMTMFFGTCVTTLGFVIGEFLPDMCIRIFTDDPELIAITHNGMKINFIFFPLIGSQMVIGNFFQSIGMPGKSILMSLSRQLLLLIPFLIILPRYYGIDGIWYSMPASDILSVILGFSLLVPQVRKLKKWCDMDKHYCICIGRKFCSGGRNVATIVAEKLGIKVYDRDLLKKAAQNTGFSEKFFDEADEEKTRKGLRSLFMGHFNSNGMSSNYLSNESIFNMQSDAIRKIHETEDCVFIGRCADYVLRDSDRLLNVFIAADTDDRVARVMRHAGDDMTESKALSLIEDIDRKRSSYYNYFTGRTWGDTAVYDICLNSTTFGYEKCADIIVSLAKEKLGI